MLLQERFQVVRQIDVDLPGRGVVHPATLGIVAGDDEGGVHGVSPGGHPLQSPTRYLRGAREVIVRRAIPAHPSKGTMFIPPRSVLLSWGSIFRPIHRTYSTARILFRKIKSLLHLLLLQMF